MAFPPDWQALLKEARVPPVALEDVQSTRTIISLVSNTLDLENVRTMVEGIRRSCDPSCDSQEGIRKSCDTHIGVKRLGDQDEVELYTPRSHVDHVTGDNFSDDIALLEKGESLFDDEDDCYLGLSDIRQNRNKNAASEFSPTFSASMRYSKSEEKMSTKSNELDTKSNLMQKIQSKRAEKEKVTPKTNLDFTTNLCHNQGKNFGVKGSDRAKGTTSAASDLQITPKESKEFPSESQHSANIRPVVNPQLTRSLVEAMAKDKRVAMVSKSMDVRNLRESLNFQIKQSPRVLRSSLDTVKKAEPLTMSSDDNIRQEKSLMKSSVKFTNGTEVDDHEKQTKSLSKSSVERSNEMGLDSAHCIGATKELEPGSSNDEKQDDSRPIPTPRNSTRKSMEKKSTKENVQEDLHSQLRQKLLERNQMKSEKKQVESMAVKSDCLDEAQRSRTHNEGQEKVEDACKDETKLSKIDNSSNKLRKSSDNKTWDSLEVDKRDVNVRNGNHGNNLLVSAEVEDISEIENDSLENSPRDSLEDRQENVMVRTDSEEQTFRVVTESKNIFGANKDENEQRTADSLNNSLKSCRQSVEAWVDEKPKSSRTNTPTQRGRKVTPPSPHNVPPPPILIPDNPPPAPPAPPIPMQDSAFLVVKSTKPEPKKSSAMSETTTQAKGAKPDSAENEESPFMVKSMELREKRELLQSTSKPHPSQLQDLSTVSKGTMTSIAEILKRVCLFFLLFPCCFVSQSTQVIHCYNKSCQKTTTLAGRQPSLNRSHG